MSLTRAVVFARPILGHMWKASLPRTPATAPASLSRVLNRGLSLTTSNLRASKVEATKEAIWDEWRDTFRCWWKRYGFWAIVRKTGISHDSTVRFRRKLKKIYYVTGLSTIARAAIPMIIGDILAQLICKYHSKNKKKKKNQESWRDFINYNRTAHFAVIGGLLIGPFAKRWNLFWSRRVRRSPPGAYLLRILLLDALLLTPLIVVIYMAGYDYKFFHKTIKDNGFSEKTYKTFKSRYSDPFSDICLFYIATKPAVAMLACFVVPCSFQTATRRLYSIMFYCILSRVITHFKLGPEITSRKSKAFKKGKHYDGGGGVVAIVADKISDSVRNVKK